MVDIGAQQQPGQALQSLALERAPAVPAAHIWRAPPNSYASNTAAASSSILQRCSILTPPPGARSAPCPLPCCSNSCSSSRSAARCTSSASAPPSWPGPCCTASSTARFAPPALHQLPHCTALHMKNADPADAGQLAGSAPGWPAAAAALGAWRLTARQLAASAAGWSLGQRSSSWQALLAHSCSQAASQQGPAVSPIGVWAWTPSQAQPGRQREPAAHGLPATWPAHATAPHRR